MKGFWLKQRVSKKHVFEMNLDPFSVTFKLLYRNSEINNFYIRDRRISPVKLLPVAQICAL